MAALSRAMTAVSVACATVSVAAAAYSAYCHHKATALADRHREAVEEARRFGELRRRGEARQAALDKYIADQRNK